MKKKVAFVLINLLLANASFSQIQFGVKGGLNISSLKDDLSTGAETKSLPGYHFGVLAHLHVNKNWAIQPEIVLSSEGARVTYPSYNITTKLKYANQVLLIQYIMANGLLLETGAQNGFLFTQQSKTSTGIETTKEDVAKTNFSWVFGVGYITRFGLGIDARYNLGLSNDYKKGIHGNAKLKSRVSQIGVFYQFRHKTVPA